MQTQGKKNRLSCNGISKKDLVAAAAFFLVFGYIFLRLRYGVGITDESFYYTVVQRVLRGDRLIADEWQVTQLSSILEIIPYKLNELLFGGTEGLILHVRYLFAFSQLLFGLHLWRRLRIYGYPALFFVLTICTFGPHYTFAYYSMALDGAVLVLTELFIAPKTPGKIKLIALGAVSALTVWVEPLLSFAYFGYTLQVLLAAVKKKRGKLHRHAGIFTPTVHTWLWLTVGICVTAAGFLTYLLASFHWNVGDIFRSIPDIFTDSEYNYGVSGENSHLTRVPLLILFSSYFFGFAVYALAFATLFYAARRRKRGMTRRQKKAIFLFSTLLVFLAYTRSIFISFFTRSGLAVIYYILISGFSLPIMMYCAILLLIADDPPPRWFAFWQTGVVMSILVDITSDACLGYGGILALLPAGVLFRDMAKKYFCEWRDKTIAAYPALGGRSTPGVLLGAFRAEHSAKQGRKPPEKSAKETKAEPEAGDGNDSALPAKKKLFTETGVFRFFNTYSVKMTVLAAVGAGTVLSASFWIAENYYMRTMMPFVERFGPGRSQWDPMDVTLARGPLKGIRTTAFAADYYDAMLEDADLIKATSDGPLYVDSRCPVPYLEADLPLGIYSSWYVEDDNPSRVLYFWNLRPERIPAVIYVPYYEASNYLPVQEEILQEKLKRLKSFFDCEEKEGKAGRILYVRDVKTLEWNETAPQENDKD